MRKQKRNRQKEQQRVLERVKKKGENAQKRERDKASTREGDSILGDRE